MSRYRHSKYSLSYIIFLFTLALFSSVLSGNKTIIQSATKALLPIIYILGLILIIKHLYNIFKEYQLSKTDIYDIDRMSGTEFEQRLIILYRNLGYKVTHIGHSGDAGVDLIVEKDGIKTAVQAKRYKGNVPESAVQQVHTGKDYYKCDRAIIVTNSFFTQMAQNVAAKTNITLWNRNTLIKELLEEHDTLTFKTVVTNSNHTNNIQQTVPTDRPKATKELIQYIRDCIHKGETWTGIKSRMLKIGWSEEALNDGFFQYYNNLGTAESYETKKFL